jgi:hypothetical protein
MAYQDTYPQFQPTAYPGMIGDMEDWSGFTRTATASIVFGAPVQRAGDNGCAPLASGGEFIGIARARHLATGTGDAYSQGDNVAVIDMAGRIRGLADATIVVGAAVNFNTVSGRYTTAAASGTVIAVPGAEADTGAAAAGNAFWIRLRRLPS